jgi:hypothetical protein
MRPPVGLGDHPSKSRGTQAQESNAADPLAAARPLSDGQLSDADSKGRHNTRGPGGLQVRAEPILDKRANRQNAAKIPSFDCGKPRKPLAV